MWVAVDPQRRSLTFDEFQCHVEADSRKTNDQPDDVDGAVGVTVDNSGQVQGHDLLKMIITQLA